ncbi:hypothetical protein J0K78_03340 [Halobacillus sp. GSS1]|uniref:hypothetical protein n=1 Tax=Halobacillus sp. GSS1 TaxID=2815919 RepID=UPI001A8CE1E1|nr:hypothetical protein [Halobacillus sp. GSS1]MBN9653288.1 hypothetical protein [Halobacillus sp. GSS1]
MIPCLNKKSINNLFNTADQRYNFSPEFFRDTHHPQIMNVYNNNELIEKITDTQLLKEIEEDQLSGNRIYILYGSTGSGKSELLCWMRDQWEVRNQKRPIIRISRNELNPQLLVKKCCESLGVKQEDVVIDESKWELLVNKPITIINQMVWSAMSEMYQSDEEIVPATMLLRPIIEKNVLEFGKQIKKGKIQKPLEVISEKDFLEILDSTSLSVELSYHKFRSLLIKKLDEFLFQGTNMSSIFKQLSAMLAKNEVRPVILIDDLVQSMNLYSAEILDYFITLEDGNWDVVIGLTPGVVVDDDNNTELKNRIRNLDTINDRVKKLWLSDESGKNFFTIDSEQSVKYLGNYITAIKKSNGYACSNSCPHANSCKELLVGSNDTLEEFPLNKGLISHIYESVPEGKGLLRHMIMNLKEILTFINDGNTNKVSKVEKFFERNIYAEHSNPLIKTLAEMYGDNSFEEITIPQKMLHHFDLESDSVTVRIRNLSGLIQTESIKEDFISKNDNLSKYVRDWLEGRKVNAQLLEPLRASVSGIVNELVNGTSIGKEHTPRMVKSNSVVRRTEVINRHKYPISIAESDKSQITIVKDVNLFKVINFHDLKTKDKPLLFNEISNDYNVSEWIYEGEKLKEEWRADLKSQLGLELDFFAYQLRSYVQKLKKLSKDEAFIQIVSPVTFELTETIEELFLDWFSLRDNMLDYNKLDTMSEDQHFEKWLLTINPPKSLNKYSIKGTPLQTFLLNLQSDIKLYYLELTPFVKEKVSELESVKPFIKLHSPDTYQELQTLSQNIKRKISLNSVLELLKMEKWFIKNYSDYYVQWKKQQKIMTNMKQILPYVGKDEVIPKDVNTIETLQSYMLDNLKIRKQVSHHLIKLLEDGKTELPKKQWKGILRDLDSLSPELFEKIIIHMSVRN